MSFLLVLVQVDDVLGGAAAWENVDWTETTCPKCDHGKAFFMQIQTRYVALHVQCITLSSKLILLVTFSTNVEADNSVITNSSGPAIFVCYNRVSLCTKVQFEFKICSL